MKAVLSVEKECYGRQKIFTACCRA